jgi:hypothetical protein
MNLSKEDREALARQRQEIRALPSTDPLGDIEVMADQLAYESECDSGPMMVLVTCTERIDKCHYHSERLAEHLAHEFLHRVMGDEANLEQCSGCGQPLIDCWRVEKYDGDAEH